MPVNSTPRTRQDSGTHMNIGELARKSGFSISTLYEYLRSGLLQPPEKDSPTKGHFTEKHVERLIDVRILKDQGKTLNDIKEHFSISDNTDTDSPEPTEEIRLAIIDKALELFSTHHYENTKISDITQALNMGNGTFYRYFKSKEELFLDCLERLPRVLVPRDAWAEVQKETDYIMRLKKRGYAMLNAFPSYIGILNYAKLALGGKDETLAKKAAECINSLVRPLAKDLKKAIDSGHVRDVDVDMCAYLLLGINETFGYLLLIDPKYTVEKSFSVIEDFISHALTHKDAGPQPCLYQARLIDCAGNTIDLVNLKMDENTFLTCYYLEGNLDIPFEKIKKMLCLETDGRFMAEILLASNENISVIVNRDIVVSGHTSIGRFSIPAWKISQIYFQ